MGPPPRWATENGVPWPVGCRQRSPWWRRNLPGRDRRSPMASRPPGRKRWWPRVASRPKPVDSSGPTEAPPLDPHPEAAAARRRTTSPSPSGPTTRGGGRPAADPPVALIGPAAGSTLHVLRSVARSPGPAGVDDPVPRPLSAAWVSHHAPARGNGQAVFCVPRLIQRISAVVPSDRPTVNRKRTGPVSPGSQSRPVGPRSTRHACGGCGRLSLQLLARSGGPHVRPSHHRHRGGVADVRLNRPDKLNALDRAMFDAWSMPGDPLRSRSVGASRGAVGRGPGVLRGARRGQLRGDGRRIRTPTSAAVATAPRRPAASGPVTPAGSRTSPSRRCTRGPNCPCR